MNENFWEVAVDAPLFRSLVYRIPENLTDTTPQRGLKVHVPLGKRSAVGVLIKSSGPPQDFAAKDIQKFYSDWPVLPDAFLKWAEWLAEYYLHPVGQVLQMASPPLEKKSKKEHKKIAPAMARSQPPQMTAEQEKVLIDLKQGSGFRVDLLHGVTGSGKTEVYFHLIEGVISAGGQVIVIVPEIALTPQLTQKLASRFGENVAIIHSHLTDRERTDQWWQVVEGKKQILVGARSALFCPMKNLQLVVVDEEHEPSYKQTEKLKYHARDAAVMLAKFFNCQIVLGSATPSLESWQNAKKKKYRLHQMKSRVTDSQLPTVEIVDLRQESQKKKQKQPFERLAIPGWMSESLYLKMIDRFEKKEQVALFLNRRGMASSIFCPSCGYSVSCPNCSVALTLHSKKHLICHYCDYHDNLKVTCPDCKVGELLPLGVGTEKIESDLIKLFPDLRVGRADRDEIQSRADIEELIRKVENHEIDLLVGTQMIAKGLDFPRVTLVGIVLADSGFNLPDFRAAERSFQLLTQMSGRAGRSSLKGEVVVQTFNPSHPSITYSFSHDFVGFAESELVHREELHYPPFQKVALIRIRGNQEKLTQETGALLKKHGLALMKNSTLEGRLTLLGPVESPLKKLHGKYRYQILVKAPSAHVITVFFSRLSELVKTPRNVKISLDVDALNMM